MTLLGKDQLKNLRLFVFTTFVEFTFALTRLGALFFHRLPAGSNLYQEPFEISIIRWSWFSFSVISYVALIGYWIKRLSVENAQVIEDANLIRLELAHKKLELSEKQLLTTVDEVKSAEAKLDLIRNDLIKQEQQLRHVLNVTGDGIWDWNILTGQVEHNLRWLEMLGVNQNQQYFSVEDFINRIHPDDLHSVQERLKLALDGSEEYQHRYRMIRPDGHQIWVEDKGAIVEKSHDGKPIRMVGAISDISNEVSAKEKVKELIFFDHLTKLPNLHYIKERIYRALLESTRSQAYSGLMYLDLNDFKLVNDIYGHQVGDTLLKEFGLRIQNAIGPTDIVARIGGDEYLILLEQIAPSVDGANKGLEAAAERILQGLADAFNLGDGIVIFATASIGIAVFGGDVKNFDEVLHYADLAMYAAKEDLTSNYRFYEISLKNEFDRKNVIYTGLREASSLNQFYVEYQPVVSRRHEYVFYEALARWKHPTLGTIMPDVFIPFAEASGQMHEVGYAILKHIFSNHSLWDSLEGKQCNLMINISAHQLMNAGFAEQFLSLGEEFLVPLDRILIEVTEGVFLNNTEIAISVMKSLKSKGVKFVLDDFGTGYSSLAYLQKLPIEYLKIDKSFVRFMTTSHDDLAIIDNILRLAKSLNLKVIAEGVETKEQFDVLLLNGCDFFQGWYFGRPSANL